MLWGFRVSAITVNRRYGAQRFVDFGLGGWGLYQGLGHSVVGGWGFGAVGIEFGAAQFDSLNLPHEIQKAEGGMGQAQSANYDNTLRW